LALVFCDFWESNADFVNRLEVPFVRNFVMHRELDTVGLRPPEESVECGALLFALRGVIAKERLLILE
jgi:hypothetical protein